MFIPTDTQSEKSSLPKGFSKAAKFRKVDQVTKSRAKAAIKYKDYVVLDIETDGLDNTVNDILEIGAVKVKNGKISEFNQMIEYHKVLPDEIVSLTGISQKELKDNGLPMIEVLNKLKELIADLPLVGYSVNFDIGFLNYALREIREPLVKNPTFDLLRYVKKEKMFLKSYRLEEVLSEYEIDDVVEHRGLEDAKLIYELSTKVNGFIDLLPGE